jgi:hypothetical protein
LNIGDLFLKVNKLLVFITIGFIGVFAAVYFLNQNKELAPKI